MCAHKLTSMASTGGGSTGATTSTASFVVVVVFVVLLVVLSESQFLKFRNVVWDSAAETK